MINSMHSKLGRTGMILMLSGLLGGCGIPAMPANMIRPPVAASSLQQDHISRELIQLLPKQAQVIVPMQSNLGQTISYGDMDGDGVDEAVVVYEENLPSGRALKAALFRQQNDQWQILSEIKGFGYGVEYAGFPDTNRDGRSELALSWSLGEAGNGLDIYELDDNRLKLVKKKQEFRGKVELD